VGVIQQCLPSEVGRHNCKYAHFSDDLACAMVPGQRDLAVTSCHFPMRATGEANGWSECTWTNGACEYNPYYPIHEQHTSPTCVLELERLCDGQRAFASFSWQMLADIYLRPSPFLSRN
jgi:hypothetical protein